MPPQTALKAAASALSRIGENHKRLIVLYDRTWQDSTADSSTDYPTNVTRFSRALKESAWCDTTDGAGNAVLGEVEQIIYYRKGVGTGLMDRVLSGCSGLGVSANVRAAYGFLAHNYEEGDFIYFFGCSRGTYTARSVAGLIASLGLLDKRGMDKFSIVNNDFYTLKKSK